MAHSFPNRHGWTPFNNLQVKSACKWTKEDLDKLNVEMIQLTVGEFFGCTTQDLPRPQLTYPHLEEVLTTDLLQDSGNPKDLTVIDFFQMVRAVSESVTEQTVDALAKTLLGFLGYQLLAGDGKVTQISIQHQTYFTMSGSRAGACTDLALVDQNRALLCLFVKDKRLQKASSGVKSVQWPHAQIIAHALGAYNTNITEARETARTQMRELDKKIASYLGTNSFDMVFPAFSFVGSCPCFYMVPITAAFASAVARGEVPIHKTKVYYCEAPVKHQFLGMMVQEQRIMIFQMFEAFKRFVPNNFAELCRLQSKLNAPIPGPISPNFPSNVWTKIVKQIEKIDRACAKKKIKQLHDPWQFNNYSTGSSATSSNPSIISYPSAELAAGKHLTKLKAQGAADDDSDLPDDDDKPEALNSEYVTRYDSPDSGVDEDMSEAL